MVDKKYVIIGFLTLLLIGSISIFAVGAETRKEGKSPYFGKGRMGHRKERCKTINNKTWNSSDLKEKLGLPEDATEEEVKEAIKEYKKTRSEEWKKKAKEKLGLPEDASDEELYEAMKKWKEENKDLKRGCGHR